MTFEEFAASLGYRQDPDGYLYVSTDPANPRSISDGALREMYSKSQGQSGFDRAWGSMGEPINAYSEDWGAYSNNAPQIVDVNGTLMRRVGPDYTSPNLAESATPPTFHPEYGWIMPDDLYNKQTNAYDTSFFEGLATNLPIILGSLVTGGALSGALGAGAGTASAAGGAAGGIGTAGAALSASELASLGFTAADMAALGLSASEIAASTAGAGAGLSAASGGLPESYWSMLADAGGGFASDAAPAAAGSFDLPYYDPFSDPTNAAYNPGGWTTDPSIANLEGVSSGSFYDPFSDPANAAYNPGGWTTNPSLAGLEGMSGAASSGNTFLDFAKKALGTPGVSQLLSGGLRTLGGVLGSRAQAGAVGDANQTLWNMYQQNRADLAGLRRDGDFARGNMVNMVTPGKQFDALSLDPGYNFRKEQGQEAIDARLRAGGKFYSGPAIKAGAEYNQNFATNEFGNVFNRNAALAGLGQTATNTTAQLGAGTAGQVANNQVDIGNARASGYATGAGGIANALDSYSSAQQFERLLDEFLKRRGTP